MKTTKIKTTSENGELLIDSETGFYSADKTACDKIKNATDAEFEEELKNFDPDTQFFLKIARQRKKEQEQAKKARQIYDETIRPAVDAYYKTGEQES